MNNSVKNSPRNVALSVIDRVFDNGSYSNLQLNQTLQQTQLKANDRRLVTQLVYGVLQRKLTLEYWLSPFLRKKPQSWVRSLLLMSIYQYQFLDRLPDWAVTDEAIKIAKFRGNEGIRRFVTGVLHAFLRKGPQSFDKITNMVKKLSVTNSVPEWLVNELIDQYGQDQAEKILTSINMPPKLSLRVNTARTSVDSVIKSLASENVDVEQSSVTENGIVVKRGNVFTTQTFKNGLVAVQDESAMLAVESMHVNPGDEILDACAAPGGKTGAIAAELKNGHVTALDIHQHKVKLIQKNMECLGLADRVSAIQLDARNVNSAFKDEQFDKILVDAPCSGIGLIRRKPEIRYDKSLADSLSLHQIQLKILDAVSTKVKKGGIIIYSTCTILQQENDETINNFLDTHSGFKLLKTKTARALKKDRIVDTLTILPSDYGSDGFFIGVIQRVK